MGGKNVGIDLKWFEIFQNIDFLDHDFLVHHDPAHTPLDNNNIGLDVGGCSLGIW